ncbi:MAG TPA: HEAT repeat domain-containing protein, partial [Myxococcota bacterium]|nr:HEAT repeat domain-containing protein [Myxococcota bacterium]
AALLARDDPALRALALRSGGGAIDDARLAAAAGDPDADVRIAAADALLARRGEAALPTALPLLFDRDERVRRETARRISRLGAPAVPALRELLSERPYGEISELSPVALALALAGADGVAALEEIAAASPDPQRRKLADLALGRLGERH